MKPKPMKAETGWAVVNPNGRPFLFAIDYTRRGAIERFVRMVPDAWEGYRKRGFTVQKVAVGPREETKR